jgi:hypothetical protein
LIEGSYRLSVINIEESHLLDCDAMWFIEEPHGITSQNKAFFIVTAGKTLNLAADKYCLSSIG